MAKLPLDSPRWGDLDGVSVEEVKEVLQAVASTVATGAGDDWREPWSRLLDGLLQQETLFSGAFAVLPHLVEAAAAAPGQFADLWADLGFMVTAEPAAPVPADLEAGFQAAVRSAEQAAVRGYLAAGTPAALCADLGLSCVALAGHHIGTLLWQRLGTEEDDLVLCCPGCESEQEITDFFVDPIRPPFEAPGLPDPMDARRGEHVWGEVAEALQEGALGEGWEPFVRVARAVAAAGVPAGTPGQAVVCLVAAMVAVKGTPDWAGRERARKLMLLTGGFRCPDCEQVWAIADCLAEDPDGARPLKEGGPTRRTGGSSKPTKPMRPTRGTATEAAVLSAPMSGVDEGVNALAVVSCPGRPTLVAAAGDTGTVFLWDAADGRPAHDPLAAHRAPVRSMTALRLPEGEALLAIGHEDGAVALWSPFTAQQVCAPVANWLGAVNGMCAATLPDGRTLLVTATPRGAVRLRDPRTGESVARLNPSGRPIESIAAIPVAPGHTLIAASDTQGDVQIWDPAVEDPWERGAAVPLSKRAREDLRHRVTLVATVSAHDRALLATGDRRGVIVLWDPATGDPVGEGLPPDASGGLLTAMTATTLPDRRPVLVTGNGRSLRVWEPETGTVQHLALDVAVTCLAATGSDLLVGHDGGVLRLPLPLRS
ncbi:WD40 repeat domain-containing protein [Streptacidiphilus melanogenes]|uniref:WD40 repeat domain-containing protein n=1 Tax=Streptacidiphilus melanogenes TaxID=411235 RepID=UPI0009FF7F1F|nr:hypothetical protein [Streptacidiphilus melanogenes]